MNKEVLKSCTALERQLLEHEGLRLSVYRCTAGKLTIAVGRNLDDVGLSDDECRALGVTPADYPRLRLTEAQALLLLRNDILRCQVDLDRNIPWWRALDAVRRRVLIDMAFNLGVAGLLKFKNTLAAVKAGNYEAAAQGMLASLWAKQVKGRATRLAQMMRTGVSA